MEEFKAKCYAVKKMFRKGLVDVNSKERTVSESAPKELDVTSRRKRQIDVEDFADLVF